MHRLIPFLLGLFVLAGCAAFLSEKPMPVADQLWRDAKGIGY